MIGQMITKRQLGIAFIVLGTAALLAVLAVELLEAGRHRGVGPMQQMALAGAGLVILVGFSLWPLGDRPA
jgi:heme A synthase